MNSVSKDKPRGKRRGAQTRLDLTKAYRNTFSGSGTRDEAEAAMVDLAKTCGIYADMGIAATGDQSRFADGQRSVWLHIAQYLRMSPEEVADLEAAVLNEQRIDSEEGA